MEPKSISGSRLLTQISIYILQGYVHSYRRITNTSEYGREWMEGQRMKKEKNNKNLPSDKAGDTHVSTKRQVLAPIWGAV